MSAGQPVDLAFVVERLRPIDVPRLRRLNVLFAEVFGDHESYLASAPDAAYIASLLGKEHLVVLVAQADGAILGGLVAYELDKFERSRREFYIYDLAVDATQRRRGIATALIANLREIAVQRGAWVIYVQADYGDEPAIALYEKIGCREDVIHFDIQVTGGVAPCRNLRNSRRPP